MAKYKDKFKNLEDFEQKLIIDKVKKADVEVMFDGNDKTIVLPRQVVTYNNDMRSASFERTVLEFIKEQKEFNARIEKRLDVIEDKLERNNIK